MKTMVLPAEDCVRAAAETLLAQIADKPDAVLAVSAGEAEMQVLRLAASLAGERGIPLEELRVFAVCEFEGLAPEDPRRVGNRIRAAFPVGSDGEDRLFSPREETAAAFDEQLRLAGGIDLALLGLGDNARVGFNEPATQFDSHTHGQKLTDRTRRELSASFGGEDRVPKRGVTMGFQQLCFAREILVIALGEEKSKAVFHMSYARDDSVYPAAFLQLPPNVTLYADEAAGALLGEKNFDAVQFNEP